MRITQSLFQTTASIVLLISGVILTSSRVASAADEIRVTFRTPTRSDVVEYVDHGDSVFADKPGSFAGISSWTVQVEAVGFFNRDTVNVNTIIVEGDTNDNITLYVTNSLSDNTIEAYGLNDCVGGIRLDSDSNLAIIARLYGDLKDDIESPDPNDRAIKSINFWCLGTIESGVSIRGANVASVRAHTIEGGVTFEALPGPVTKIGGIRTGYFASELDLISGVWPTTSQMDIGTAASPISCITPAGADLAAYVTSMDDLYVDLAIGGNTYVLRNQPPSGEIYDYSVGSPTRRMRITGETVTLGDIFADSAYGGYLDTGTGEFRITSSTTDYAGTIEAVEGGSGANEVDFRGRFWFDAGVSIDAVLRLNDDMNGETIFNAQNNQRTWHQDSLVSVDGTNLSPDNPSYALVPNGGGTVGMVDGVGNQLGFSLHHEACVPLSGQNGVNKISSAGWQACTAIIYLEFYGPVYTNGVEPCLAIEWFDPAQGQWVAANGCMQDLSYAFTSSGANTSTNILAITGCSTTTCFIPLGEYRFSMRAGALKSDLGLATDPDVQAFYYYFTMIQ